jgi:hypothetical protein
MKNLVSRLLLALVLTVCAITAYAHSRSESYSHWHQADNRLTVTVTMPAREVTRLPDVASKRLSVAAALSRHLLEKTSVHHLAGPCELTETTNLQSAPEFVRIELHFDCGTETPATLHYRGMFDAAPSHVHYAKYYSAGEMRAEFLLTDAVDSWAVPAMEATDHAQSWSAFVLIGLRHIVGGPDHIAFVLGMLLVAGSTRRGVIAVTGFTLGHSISLAAAVLGYVTADGQLVEALIGFTVALVALEYFVLRHRQPDVLALSAICFAWLAGTIALVAGTVPARAVFAYLGIGVFAGCYLLIAPRMRDAGNSSGLLVATTCFGLIHGFGFAGFLMQTGMLGSSLFLPLMGFNIGVEFGQLLLISIVLTLALLLRRATPNAAPQLVAAGLCGLGVFWFMGRTLGL